MIDFNPAFDLLREGEIELRITEKSQGNEEIIPFYYYDIYRMGKMVGKISIRIGENYHSYYNGHVGYEINEEDRGHRISLTALRMVLPVARYHGMRRIYLTCEEENAASARIIELSGARYLETVTIPKDYFGWYEGIGKYRVYQLGL